MQQEVGFDLVTWSPGPFSDYGAIGFVLLGTAFLATLTPGVQSFLRRVLAKQPSRLAVASIAAAACVSVWLGLGVAATAAVAVWAAAPACALSLLEHWESRNAARMAQLECGLAMWLWLPLCLSVPAYMSGAPVQSLTSGFLLALCLSVLVFLGARPSEERKWRVPAGMESKFVPLLAAFTVVSLPGPAAGLPPVLVDIARFGFLTLVGVAGIAAVEFVLGSVAQVSVEQAIGPGVGAEVVIGAFTGALASSVASSASTFWLLLAVFTPLGFAHSLIFREQTSAVQPAFYVFGAPALALGTIGLVVVLVRALAA